MMISKRMKKSIISIVVSSIIVTGAAQAASPVSGINWPTSSSVDKATQTVVDDFSVQVGQAVADHEQRLTSIEASSPTAIKQIADDNAKAISDHETRLSAAESDIVTMEGDVQQARTDADSVKRGLIQTNTNLNFLRTDLTTDESRIDDLEKDTVKQPDFDTFKTDTQNKLDAKADKTELDQQKTDLTDAINAEKQRATTAEAGIAINAKALATKVDQAAVDKSVAVETSRATGAEQALEQKKADKSQIATLQGGITTNSGAISTLTTTVQTDETQIKQNKSDIATNAQTEQGHFTTLQTAVSQAQSTGDYAQSRADAAYANTQANRQVLDNTNKRVADNSKQLANHEQRITDLEANNQTNFNKLEKQQNRDRKEFRSGIAGAIALSQIPAVPTGQTVGFGMAVGTFNGENAVSAGVGARVSQNVSVKTGLSWDSQGNVGAGAGFLVSY